MAEAPAGSLPRRKKHCQYSGVPTPAFCPVNILQYVRIFPLTPWQRDLFGSFICLWWGHSLIHLPVALAAHSLRPPSSFTTAPSHIFLYQSCVSSSLVRCNYTRSR